MNETGPKTNPFGGAPGQEGVDAAFIIVCAFIVFTMQSGFGLLESGMVSRRSQANVMVKNMLDVCLGGVAYWFVGYGFSFGENSGSSKTMSGESHFITHVDVSENSDEAHVHVLYFFQLAFATTATTIVSGAVAERVKLGSYMIFAVINTALIYTFPCHWIWSEDGWLYGKTKDFAGSAVVHMSGGAAAIAATLVLKPRLGRYKEHTKYFAMANPTNTVLGTFFLWWGWIGFNCGSQLAISGGNWRYVGRVAVVTMNGALGGGAGAVILNMILNKNRKPHYILDIGQFTAAILGGLVSITACSDVIRPWEAMVIGLIGGEIALGIIVLCNLLKIDDPVGCIGVHWGSGFWAMIATGLFADVADEPSASGVFRHGTGELLGWNVLACVVVTAWSGGLAAIVFLALKYTIGIRITVEEEMKGSDEVEHGISAEYSAEEYKHALGMYNIPNININIAKSLAPKALAPSNLANVSKAPNGEAGGLENEAVELEIA